MKKEYFVNFIDQHDKYNEEIEKISSFFGDTVYDSNLNQSVGMMFDIFIDSHFTEKGADWINAFIFENWRGDIYEKDTNKVLFTIDNIDDLWDYLCTDPKTYFK